MDSVTSKFNKYDLSEICSEYISQADPNHAVPLLPKYVGGSEVHLLLGIKNTNLDPVWIKTLPCGVACIRVYSRTFGGLTSFLLVPIKRLLMVINPAVLVTSFSRSTPSLVSM